MTTIQNQNMPKIRFLEFNDAWESKKLNKL